MKKWIAGAVGVGVALSVILMLVPCWTKNCTSALAAKLDEWNPAVAESEVYVATAVKSVHVGGSKRGCVYRYILNSWNQGGQSRKLALTTVKTPLDSRSFLQVRVKGQKVLGFHAISFHALPKKVQGYLHADNE